MLVSLLLLLLFFLPAEPQEEQRTGLFSPSFIPHTHAHTGTGASTASILLVRVRVKDNLQTFVFPDAQQQQPFHQLRIKRDFAKRKVGLKSFLPFAAQRAGKRLARDRESLFSIDRIPLSSPSSAVLHVVILCELRAVCVWM